MARFLEIIGEGLVVAVIAMVFIALFALIFNIKLVRTQKKNTQQPNKDTMEQNAAANSTDIVDSEELIAVITAAIAASLNRSTHSIVVQSIRRVPSVTPVWNQAGKHSQIASRF